MKYEPQRLKTEGRQRRTTVYFSGISARLRSSWRNLELRVDLLGDGRIFGGKVIRIAVILCHHDV
jgi:hypothetical protein